MNCQEEVNVILFTSFCGPGYFVAPPIGLYRIKFVLECHNITTVVWDRSIEDEKTLEELIIKNNFNILGFSVSHHYMLEDLNFLWKVRKTIRSSGKPFISVAGGHEASMNCREWLENGIDVVLNGFAEESMLNFCINIKNNSFSTSYFKLLKDVDGYAFISENNELIEYPKKKLTQNDFRKYSYEIMLKLRIPFDKYWNKIKSSSEYALNKFNKSTFKVKNVRLYTISHCHRGCGFCASQSFIDISQKSTCPIFMLTAQEVLRLVIFYVNEIGAESFMINDDDFPIGNKKGISRLKEFCSLVIKAKQKQVIPENILFNCQARIQDFVIEDNQSNRKIPDESLIKLLKKAGFQTIAVGVETFSDRLLQAPSINKKGQNVQMSRDVLDALLHNQLVPQINIILGIPETTVDDIFNSMDEAIEYLIKGCQVSLTPFLMTFPGAPLYSNNSYKKFMIETVNPETQKKIKIAEHFTIHNPKINRIFEKLNNKKEKEINRIISKGLFSNNFIPKYMVALATFIAVAKIFERNEWVVNIKKKLLKCPNSDMQMII